MDVDAKEVRARLQRATVVVRELKKLGLHHLAHLEALDGQMFAAEWRVRYEEALHPVNAPELEKRRDFLSALRNEMDCYKRKHGSESRARGMGHGAQAGRKWGYTMRGA